MRIQRALVSVTNKEGVVDLCRALVDLGVEVISTGGTAKVLIEAGLRVTLLEDYTGSPEMLDGRVKTLHPKVHAGILARRDLPDHTRQLAERSIPTIDLVAVNLYDFTGATARGLGDADVIENIDIGGPTLLRAAAKNHEHVVALSEPSDYGWVVDRLRAEGDIAVADRRRLAGKIYATTSAYDAHVASYLSGTQGGPAPLVLEEVLPLRYGENPHQAAGFYQAKGASKSSLAAAVRLQGKELSYNNLLDLDAALGLVRDIEGPACVYIKHNNPCGVALGANIADTVARARACDPVSAFGGVVAINRPVDESAARALTETFLEAVIAPHFTPEARAILLQKSNVRALELEGVGAWSAATDHQAREIRQVRGGFLLQNRDAVPRLADEVENGKVVTRRAPTPDERKALVFAWAVAKHVRSNAIVFAKPDATVAVGAGQMSRVDSVKLCVLKAGAALRGGVVASDAFFPFRDGVDVLTEAGASAIVQPGGSIRDEEVIRAADEAGVAMIFTGVRHFRH